MSSAVDGASPGRGRPWTRVAVDRTAKAGCRRARPRVRAGLRGSSCDLAVSMVAHQRVEPWAWPIVGLDIRDKN